MESISKFLFILLLALYILPEVSAATTKDAATPPYLTKEFTLQEPGLLNVNTIGGSIDVKAHEGNTVKVEMYLKKGNKEIEPGDPEGEKILQDFKLDISQSANTVTVTAEKKDNTKNYGRNHPDISFTVYVPKRISSNLHAVGGSIEMDGVEGDQEVKTVGGSLNFKNMQGNTEASTAGGSISIANYSGAINAQTSGGSIDLQDSKGDLKVHTSGGSIKIENTSGTIDASTSGGSIKAKLLTLDNSVKLSTSGGSIKAVLPSGKGLDLDLEGNNVNTKLQNFSGEADKGRVKGSMNGGGILVVMSTRGGSVNLDYQ